MTGVEEAFVSLFLSYLFKQVEPNIKIESAPYWYMKEIDKNKYTKSTYFDGDIDSILKAKEKLKNLFIKRIDESSQKTSDAINARITSKNNDVTRFVSKNIIYENIKYSEEQKRTFIRGFILKSNLESYQRKRLYKSKIKSLDNSFDEMMNEIE